MFPAQEVAALDGFHFIFVLYIQVAHIPSPWQLT